MLNDLLWKWTEIILSFLRLYPRYCILDSFLDCDGYSISSKGFLPTVVDIMVIWVKFTHFSPSTPRALSSTNTKPGNGWGRWNLLTIVWGGSWCSGSILGWASWDGSHWTCSCIVPAECLSGNGNSWVEGREGGVPGSSASKESTYNAGDLGLIPWSVRSSGEDTHSSILGLPWWLR